MKLTHILENFKLFKKPRTKIKIKFPLLQYFTERSMEQIYAFPIKQVLQDENEIMEHFELEYELEYKYSMMKNNPFRGHPTRYENTLKILEGKARQVVIPLAKTFLIVFEEWLSAHAITNPEQWAEARFRDTEGMENILETIFYEWKRYDIGNSPLAKPAILQTFFKRIIDKLNNMEVVKYKLEELAGQYKRERAEMDLEDVEAGHMELEEWNQMYGVEAKDIDDAGDFIDVIEADADPEEALEYVDSLESFENILSNNDNAYIELYREIVFPWWFRYWKAQGIEETRARIEEAYKGLKSIARKPIEKQFMTLNIVKNISHQTGSMMDYYEEKYGISDRELQALSDTDVTPWNKELKQIGVEIR